jgi:hypothetical protein
MSRLIKKSKENGESEYWIKKFQGKLLIGGIPSNGRKRDFIDLMHRPKFP